MFNTINDKEKALLNKIHAIKDTIGPIIKDAINDYYKSKYFDINKLLDTLNEPLSQFDLLITQPIMIRDFSSGPRNVIITCVTDLNTGDQYQSDVLLPDNTDPQKIGSSITYLRRYSIQSMLGLQAEDDDGNTASHGEKKPEIKSTLNDLVKEDANQKPVKGKTIIIGQ